MPAASSKKEETDRIMSEAKQQLNEEFAKVRAQFNQSSEAVSQLRDQFESSKGRENGTGKNPRMTRPNHL